MKKITLLILFKFIFVLNVYLKFFVNTVLDSNELNILVKKFKNIMLLKLFLLIHLNLYTVVITYFFFTIWNWAFLWRLGARNICMLCLFFFKITPGFVEISILSQLLNSTKPIRYKKYFVYILFRSFVLYFNAKGDTFFIRIINIFSIFYNYIHLTFNGNVLFHHLVIRCKVINGIL